VTNDSDVDAGGWRTGPLTFGDWSGGDTPRSFCFYVHLCISYCDMLHLPFHLVQRPVYCQTLTIWRMWKS